MLIAIDTKRPRFFTQNLTAILALGLGILVLTPAARAERKAILHPGSTAHASPDDSSLSLGTYSQRTTVTLSNEPQSGWYRVYFPRPVRGVSEGWIPESAIESFVAPGQQPSARAKPRRKRQSWEDDDQDSNFRKKKTYLGVIFDLVYSNPSSFQSQIGESTGNLGYLGYGLDFGYRFSESFTGSSRFSYYSFSEKSAVTGISDAYDAKGYILSVAGDFDVASGGRFETGPGFGLGLSFNTVSNTNLSLQKSTSGITQPLYFFRWVAGLGLGSGTMALRAEVGYRIMTLSNVPVTPIGNPTQSTLANLSLGGLYGGLGFYFQF